jgi:hypothetical protein
MKTLFPIQERSVAHHTTTLMAFGASLDTSVTGVGKTVVAAHTAMRLRLPVIVVCPKITIPQWERELADAGVKPVLVTNYEKLRRGNKMLIKTGKRLYRWDLPKKHLIIWDECHRLKGAKTQTPMMLVAAKNAGHCNLLLSATACKDPTEMRAIGYALGLHSLTHASGNLKSWTSWMQDFGCYKDPWNNWVPGNVRKLEPLNRALYPTLAVKVMHADLPGAFTENHIITEPLAFASIKQIAAFYAEQGVTPEIIERILAGEKPSQHMVVQILRARQLAEAAKVPDIIEMTNQAVDEEGFSVAIFVNFSDTLQALVKAFEGSTPCSAVYGGQTGEERERHVQDFQSGRTRIIVCNTAAGGVGVSLHDTVGGRPRMSLISPSFNVEDYIQVLGRTHRAGAKSPTTQRVLVASGTVEEHVITILEKKRKYLETLHAQAAEK